MNFQVWTILSEGGPWAAALLLLGWVIWMRLTERWVPEKAIDRAVTGHMVTITHQATELAYWRQAAGDKDKTIQTLADQNAKLMIHSAVSAHALESITKPLNGHGQDVTREVGGS